jgi:hypothetical protein
MLNRKSAGIVVLMGAALLLSAQANAATITEGFEGSSYDFYATPGATAALSTTTVHSGSQSVFLSIPTGPDYARVALPESGFTLQQITSADFWANRASTNSGLSPYLIIGLNCPTCLGGAYAGNDIIAIMNVAGGLPQNTWTDLTIDPNTTSFHLYNNDTSTNIILNTTLAALYADWGIADVAYTKIGFGLAGGPEGGTNSFYVDDLTINTASATPLPAALPLFASGLGALGLLGWRRKRKAVVLAA